MRRIENFTEFVKHIALIAFWLIVIIPILVAPILLLAVEMKWIPLPVSPYVFIMDPVAAIEFQMRIFTSDFGKIALFPGFTYAALFAAFLGLWERKLLAKLQLRVGPLYAGRVEGILQPLADILKLLFKELITPTKSDKLLFLAAPLITVAIASATISVIPASEFWVVARSDVGLLVVFAAIGFFPITALMAAWGSNSKYPFLGGLRALHQLVAYEIPMIVAALGVVILAGSLDLINIVKAQAAIPFIFLLPLGAITFFWCSLAELERVPFDLPEAEPELVAGWLTEYTGMNFGLILGIAVYVKFYALAAIFTTLFLGGWMGPSPIPPEVWFTIKTFLVATVMILPRGIFPRIRIDILLRRGWVTMLILAFINIFIAVLVVELGIVTPGALT